MSKPTDGQTGETPTEGHISWPVVSSTDVPPASEVTLVPVASAPTAAADGDAAPGGGGGADASKAQEALRAAIAAAKAAARVTAIATAAAARATAQRAKRYAEEHQLKERSKTAAASAMAVAADWMRRAWAATKAGWHASKAEWKARGKTAETPAGEEPLITTSGGAAPDRGHVEL
mmetsp:Transcript_14394/g.50053  ORF Transcript_14394/g.50053 Transcript_14394/m.50053 type:complete len:176 (-) Transcript_14394:54-581(-)|eukprot:CAMPEP_0203814452 /NCGR_PEP_ID=MMETSP0115-20131106/5295_1 /ASSEMBLY_ACC=CAM_ASM_000227 /TAXON_ID=33651 /ORGANISM="Bicosoecid sp, Strain ms1" /LENGTH=175 /DNA_ID=CAMNT_0050723331 /DNA_START=65 /DNA_END=592 /DNA_ORIENTATION=-